MVKENRRKKIETYRAVSVLSSKSNKMSPEGKNSKINVKVNNPTPISTNASSRTNLKSQPTTIGSESNSSSVEKNGNKRVGPMSVLSKSTTEATDITDLESNVDLLQETKSIDNSRKQGSIRVDCVSISRVKKEAPRRNNPSHAFVTRIRKSVSLNI